MHCSHPYQGHFYGHGFNFVQNWMPDEIVFVSTIHNSGKYIFHMFFKKLQHFRTVVVPPLDLDGQQVRVEGDFLSLLLRHQKARLQFFCHNWSMHLSLNLLGHMLLE